ncbi:MAG TPA: tRNA lysidine(34) synthetase TilS [Nitrospirota bacterium]
MLTPRDRVLVAVSGGPDSVCLLSVLKELASDWDLSLHVAHLDHMFRGKQSADEALFVADIAKKLNIPATIEKIDVPAYCRERGLSPQAGAREARYSFFALTAQAIGAHRIATGHTADDQAETFLMRLLRGAGAAGLSAIPPRRDNIIRPLIGVTREEVMEYVRSRKLEFMSDPSNSKPVYTRNRIRMDVLPALKKFNPRIVGTLASEAALLRDENEAVEAHLAGIAERVITQEKGVLLVKRDEFNALPTAFRRRLLRTIAGLAGMEPSTLSFDRIGEALSFMAAARTGRTMNLASSLTIGREYGRFVIGAKEPLKGFMHSIAVPGVTAIPELDLTVETSSGELRKAPEDDDIYLWQAVFDYDKIRSFLTLRNRRPGDRFQPAGMAGRSKKLQDYFVDEKIPRRKRNKVPLLCSGEDILWVMGHRLDGRFLPGPKTKKVLFVRVRN